MNRIQLWSCGGGRQSAGIAAMIVQGVLPRPDHVAMTALEWERKATYRYVIDFIRPAMRALGIPFTFVHGHGASIARINRTRSGPS